MKTSGQMSALDDGVARISHAPAPGDTEPGWRGGGIALAIALMVVAMAVTGIAVYAWQHEQVVDRDAALAIALQQRDEAQQDVTALRDAAAVSAGEVATLEARVELLRARVDELRSTAVGGGSQIGSAPSCNAEDMLAAIRREVPIADPMVWRSVTIQECQNGFALVSAHPGNIPAGSNVEDSEQVFLRYAGGAWTVVASGTGITCSDPDLSPELAEVCTGLGLR